MSCCLICPFVMARPLPRRTGCVTLLPCALWAELCSPQNVGVRANSRKRSDSARP
jgi:hypothetical protein